MDGVTGVDPASLGKGRALGAVAQLGKAFELVRQQQEGEHRPGTEISMRVQREPLDPKIMSCHGGESPGKLRGLGKE